MKKYWVSYDLDGSFDVEYCEGKDFRPTSHLLGSYDTLAKAKKAIIESFKFCINELKMGIQDVKKIKKNNLN